MPTVCSDLAAARDRRVLAEVSHPVEGVFESVEALRKAMLSIAASEAVAGGLRSQDLVALRPAVTELLARHAGFVAGAGVVLAPGVLADAPLWIDWWLPLGNGGAERLEVDLDPASADFYDYTTTEWFRQPRMTGERHIAGPYVDFICTHEYTFTVSAPLFYRDRFFGVAGADILAAKVEQLVGRSLVKLPYVAAVASGSGRIISSNRSTLMPGTVLGRESQWRRLRAVAGSEHPGAGGPDGGASAPCGPSSVPWVLLRGEAEGGRA